MAYEVTDCGIVVGQMRRQVALPGGGAPLVYQGFFYLDRARFGRSAGDLEFLPSLLPSGVPSPITPSIARDVNADGWIVGDMGQDPDLSDFTFVPRAAAWRISDASTPFVRAITPPQPVEGESGGERVYGWLGAVSEGEEPWAAFTFEGPTCTIDNGSGPGGPVPRSDLIASVRLGSSIAPEEPLQIRTLCSICPEPDVTSTGDPSGRLAALGISANGDIVCGSRQICSFELNCHGPVLQRARQWFPAELCPEVPCSDELQCRTCLTPDPVSEGFAGAAARQHAVLVDGSAVGFVTDAWPELGEGVLVQCGAWAFAWEPLPPDWCEASGAPSPCGNGGYAPTTVGSRLPLPAIPNRTRSEAFDLEFNETAAHGLHVGHFAVGFVESGSDPDGRGLVWFAEGDQVSDWAVADINELVSPTPPIEGYSSFVVRALRGVNTRGDAVGTAEFTPTDGTDPVRRAVLLRAVPSGLAGDLDGDGMVGASDLAILLDRWCPSSGAPCDPIADLNCDGMVGAADLSALLANWGNGAGTAAATRGGEPVPEAIALDSKDAVEFSIEFVGLDGIEGYKEWAATAPAPLRELVEQVVWNTAKGGVE
jgi:hypothetical protein